MTDTANNKRVAKNTLMLYFRMMLIMGVSLYTVRVILETLGSVDYGIYNVVAGVVTMFTFLSGTMAAASQRFFAFELGRKNYDQLKKTFSMTMTIYIIIAVIILLLAETVGLWFINNKMTIPMDRMKAAQWVYQFSIFSFMMTMFTIPYNSAIIAHENMKVFAWVSIIEAILKLIILYILVQFAFDKLIFYAILMFSVTTIVTFIYRTYCKRKYIECHYQFHWNKQLFKEILTFSGWNLFGAMAAIFKNQGINIILNIFFNPVINTARAIAYQVNSALNQFVFNFSTAVKPQITKYYAKGEIDKMNSLVIQSSKFSYYLLFILSIPILFETHFILSIWLTEIPEYVVLFTQLLIINALIDSLSQSLISSALATGKIKQYQIVVGGVMLLNLPVSYIFLKQGASPQTTMYIGIVIALINLYLRLIMLKRIVQFPIKRYLTEVILRTTASTALAYVVILGLYYLSLDEGWIRFILVISVGILAASTSIYTVGLNQRDKCIFKSFMIKNLKNKLPFKNIISVR